MYLLKVEASFDAAHRLPDYNGPCRRIHGHHWVVQATYEQPDRLIQGLSIDLTVLRRLLREAVAIYDHQSLNQIMACIPTAENLARTIFNNLRSKDFGQYLTQVAVEETRGAAVVYKPDPPKQPRTGG